MQQEPQKSGRGGKREGAGRRRNEVRAGLEKSFGLSARRVQQIVKELNLDQITDMGELKLVEKRITIALRSIQAKREEHLLDVAKRSVLPSGEVFAVGQKAGIALSQSLHDWLGRMPAELAGHDEIQIYTILRREVAAVIDDFRRQVAKA